MVLPDVSAVRNFNFYKQSINRNKDNFIKAVEKTSTEVDYTKLEKSKTEID